MELRRAQLEAISNGLVTLCLECIGSGLAIIVPKPPKQRFIGPCPYCLPDASRARTESLRDCFWIEEERATWRRLVADACSGDPTVPKRVAAICNRYGATP